MRDFLFEPFGYRFRSFHAIAKIGMAGIGGDPSEKIRVRSRGGPISVAAGGSFAPAD
jgi:hypothetical protein